MDASYHIWRNLASFFLVVAVWHVEGYPCPESQAIDSTHPTLAVRQSPQTSSSVQTSTSAPIPSLPTIGTPHIGPLTISLPGVPTPLVLTPPAFPVPSMSLPPISLPSLPPGGAPEPIPPLPIPSGQHLASAPSVNVNLPALVGGMTGGLAALCLCIGALLFRRWRRETVREEAERDCATDSEQDGTPSPVEVVEAAVKQDSPKVDTSRFYSLRSADPVRSTTTDQEYHAV